MIRAMDGSDVNSERATRLGRDAVGSLLLRFSAPAIVGMLAQALYNFIDAVFVGRALGDDALAGITVAFPFMLVSLAFSMLVGIGGAALISIRLGQHNHREAERILGNATTLLVVAALVITIAGLAAIDRILSVFGANETILPFARDYLEIILFGTIVQMVGFGLNAMIRGEGNPRIAMFSMLISVAMNIVLAPLFLFGFGWGMKGAAWATVLSQAVSAVWVVTHFVRGASVLRLRLADLRPDWRLCANICAVGSPPFATQLAASVLQGIFNHQLRIYGGVPAIAIMGIIYRMMMMIAMPVFGINQGSQPIIGYNYGARRFDRVKRTLELAILAGSAITMLGFVIMMFFPSQLIRFFVPSDEELVAMGSSAVQIVALMLPLVGFQIVGAAYFQAVGKPRKAMLLMLSRQVLLLIPAILILPTFFGLRGVWYSVPVADLGSSVLTGLCLFVELRHLGRHASA